MGLFLVLFSCVLEMHIVFSVAYFDLPTVKDLSTQNNGIVPISHVKSWKSENTNLVL